MKLIDLGEAVARVNALDDRCFSVDIFGVSTGFYSGQHIHVYLDSDRTLDLIEALGGKLDE